MVASDARQGFASISRLRTVFFSLTDSSQLLHTARLIG